MYKSGKYHIVFKNEKELLNLIEFWIMGPSIDAREKLTTVMCDLHVKNFGRERTGCVDKNTNEQYGLDGYRKISQESVEPLHYC